MDVLRFAVTVVGGDIPATLSVAPSRPVTHGTDTATRRPMIAATDRFSSWRNGEGGMVLNHVNDCAILSESTHGAILDYQLPINHTQFFGTSGLPVNSFLVCPAHQKLQLV